MLQQFKDAGWCMMRRQHEADTNAAYLHARHAKSSRGNSTGFLAPRLTVYWRHLLRPQRPSEAAHLRLRSLERDLLRLLPYSCSSRSLLLLFLCLSLSRSLSLSLSLPLSLSLSLSRSLSLSLPLSLSLLRSLLLPLLRSLRLLLLDLVLLAFSETSLTVFASADGFSASPFVVSIGCGLARSLAPSSDILAISEVFLTTMKKNKAADPAARVGEVRP